MTRANQTATVVAGDVYARVCAAVQSWAAHWEALEPQTHEELGTLWSSFLIALDGLQDSIALAVSFHELVERLTGDEGEEDT